MFMQTQEASAWGKETQTFGKLMTADKTFDKLNIHLQKKKAKEYESPAVLAIFVNNYVLSSSIATLVIF